MKRRNDSGWRAEGIAKRGQRCRSCGRFDIQADHIRPRSQGGKSVPENFMALCVDCHTAKTEHRLLIQKDWLDDDQLEWLRDTGWVWWQDGETYGEGRRSFAPDRRDG